MKLIFSAIDELYKSLPLLKISHYTVVASLVSYRYEKALTLENWSIVVIFSIIYFLEAFVF